MRCVSHCHKTMPVFCCGHWSPASWCGQVLTVQGLALQMLKAAGWRENRGLGVAEQVGGQSLSPYHMRAWPCLAF